VTTPSTDWKENIPEGEDAALEKLARELVEPLRARASEGKSVGRALHFKQHTGAKAKLEVREVPEHARHGLFARPATYDAYVRFSNGAGRHQKDSEPDVRGIGLKVLGVGGRKVIPGLEDEQTQDFLFIPTPTIPFRTAEEFVGFVSAARGGPLLLLPRYAFRVGLGRAISIVRRILKTTTPFRTFAGARMFTAVPNRFGPFAARFKLEPVGERDDSVTTSGDDSLAADLRERLAKAPLEWDLAAQFFVDEKTTPIEDATVDWSSPFTTLARLTVPRQELEPKTDELIETLAFDPWHALAEHRPLGHIMRARNHAYRLSTMERKAAAEPR
jgi:hypothetical protein